MLCDPLSELHTKQKDNTMQNTSPHRNQRKQNSRLTVVTTIQRRRAHKRYMR